MLRKVMSNLLAFGHRLGSSGPIDQRYQKWFGRHMNYMHLPGRNNSYQYQLVQQHLKYIHHRGIRMFLSHLGFEVRLWTKSLITQKLNLSAKHPTNRPNDSQIAVICYGISWFLLWFLACNCWCHVLCHLRFPNQLTCQSISNHPIMVEFDWNYWMSNQAISHHLGTPEGWRSKRLKIAMALRSQGWTYKLISEYLLVTPKSLMRDIKCFVINPRNLPR